jgi:hypothetical protein
MFEFCFQEYVMEGNMFREALQLPRSRLLPWGGGHQSGKLMLVLVSTAILGSGLRGTQDHIFLVSA